jgi:hypothetical protein
VVRLVWTLAAIVPLVFVASVADAQDGGAASARADASPRVPAVGVVANDGGHLDASSSASPEDADAAVAASVAMHDGSVPASVAARRRPPLPPSVASATDTLSATPVQASPSREAQAASPAPGTSEAASRVVQTILGLLVLLGLAVLGAHPRVRRLESALGISQVVTAGFPFVALGLVARMPQVGLLDDRVLAQIAPLLQLGLGWVGFLTGYQFEVRALDDFPRGTAAFVGAMTSLPFAVVVAACGGLLLAFGQPWQDAVFLRDAVVLGAAATITAPIAASIARERGVAPGTQAVLTRLGLLDDIAGIVGLLFLGAYFRPATTSVAWALPGTAWLFVTIGLGFSVGVVVYLVLRRPATNVEQVALVVGCVAFAAGLAGVLRLSPVVVCFLAGLLVGNLPGDYRPRVRKVLRLLERPIYLVFLVFAGALWNVGDWRGWVLVPVFVLARLGGRALGVRAAERTGGASELAHGRAGIVTAPMGALSIAIVISFQTLFAGRAVPWIVTAVIGGAIVTEFVVQLGLLGGRAPAPTIPAPPGGAR